MARIAVRYVGAALALPMLAFAYLIATDDPGPEMLGLLIASSLVGLSLLVVGCGFYAKSKGRSRLLGALGVLGPIGMFILLLIKERPLEIKSSTNYLRYPEGW